MMPRGGAMAAAASLVPPFLFVVRQK